MNTDEEDLSKEIFPLSHYASNRKRLLDEVFSILKSHKLESTIPPSLRGIDYTELKALCLDELEKIDTLRIVDVIEGRLTPGGTSGKKSEYSGKSMAKKRKSSESEVEAPVPVSVPKKKVKKSALKESGDEESKVKESKKKKDKKKKKSKKESSDVESEKKAKSSKAKVKSKVKSKKSKKSKKEKKNKGEKEQKSSVLPGERTLMELLELEYRAKAIKALLKFQGFGDSKLSEVFDDESKEEAKNTSKGETNNTSKDETNNTSKDETNNTSKGGTNNTSKGETNKTKREETRQSQPNYNKPSTSTSSSSLDPEKTIIFPSSVVQSESSNKVPPATPIDSKISHQVSPGKIESSKSTSNIDPDIISKSPNTSVELIVNAESNEDSASEDSQSSSDSSEDAITNSLRPPIPSETKFELSIDVDDDLDYGIPDEELPLPSDTAEQSDSDQESDHDDKSIKTDYKSSKIDDKNSKTDDKSSKTDDKSSKIDDKSIKIDDKSSKTDYKSIKNDYRSIKNDYRSIKTDYKSVKNDYKSSTKSKSPEHVDVIESEEEGEIVFRRVSKFTQEADDNFEALDFKITVQNTSAKLLDSNVGSDISDDDFDSGVIPNSTSSPVNSPAKLEECLSEPEEGEISSNRNTEIKKTTNNPVKLTLKKVCSLPKKSTKANCNADTKADNKSKEKENKPKERDGKPKDKYENHANQHEDNKKKVETPVIVKDDKLELTEKSSAINISLQPPPKITTNVNVTKKVDKKEPEKLPNVDEDLDYEEADEDEAININCPSPIVYPDDAEPISEYPEPTPETEYPDEATPVTWYERWYSSKKVQKLVNSTKMCGKVRNKLRTDKQNLRKEPEKKVAEPTQIISKEAEPDIPIIGSIEEYEKLFGKKLVAQNLDTAPPPKSDVKSPGRTSEPEEEEEEEDEDDELWGDIMGSA